MITIKSRTELTDAGKFGAVLFVAGPIVTAFMTSNLLSFVESQSRYGFAGGNITAITVFTLACSAASLLGFVLLLIGREEIYQVHRSEEVVEDVELEVSDR